ncbi:hypothetical protein [Salibacterium qingdaonense]|uniref:Uncharacterized protein n=1 Tax=Salibacterium qingdaonense TaxID=266892 RepID=A0A1I4R7K2_9BACI|nr:hypothetical protein [Salibacterium qingdaonense]SFM47930.1 hypothetical protein SAMN04488054_1681 [Salibacterium qingdaonense]
MKKFKLFRTWVFLALFSVAGIAVFSVVNAEDKDNHINVDERFSEFIKDNGYDESIITEDRFQHTNGELEVLIDGNMGFEQADMGRYLAGVDKEVLKSSIYAPAEQKYFDHFINFAKLTMQEEYNTGFKFEEIIKDVYKRDSEYVEEYYFNDNVNISVTRPKNTEREQIRITVIQNINGRSFGKKIQEQYRDKGISQRLEP